ncbi:MAG: 3-hydroxyanthranilate 3,4-dioxygenase, partial [Microcoleus sp. SIO2G3]|nr:3-hydroxyanthranilate 3,4-dioxygenase [Microcoleus sp. SIO2G3]
MAVTRPFDFQKWIDEHRHLLKPPVGNKLVFENAEFIVQVVGGPNSRKDYHFDEGEEFFYQIEGDILVKIQEDGK